MNKLFYGNMNSGKTEKCIYPLIDKMIDNNESMFILDSKYEYINEYSDKLKNNKYNIIILDLKELDNSDTFNPLYLPYKLYKENKNEIYLNILENIIASFVKSDTSIDPFWENSASNLIMGLILTLFYKGNEEEINFSSVYKLLSMESNGCTFKDYFNDFKNTSAYNYANTTICAPIETKGGIVSVALQKIGVLANREILSKFLSVNSFDIEDILTKKTAIIFVNYDSTTIYNKLVNSIIGELYYYLECKNNKIKFNFVLDNMDTLSPIVDFKNMLINSNNKNIDFIVATRDLKGLTNTYTDYINKTFEIIESKDSINPKVYEKVKFSNKLPKEVKTVVIQNNNVSTNDLIDIIDKKIAEIEDKES